MLSHLFQHFAQGKDIGSHRHRLAGKLLRAGEGLGKTRGLFPTQARQTKINQFDPSSIGYQHVVGFQIQVQYQVGVGGSHGIQQLGEQLQPRCPVWLALLQILQQRQTVHILRHHKG